MTFKVLAFFAGMCCLMTFLAAGQSAGGLVYQWRLSESNAVSAADAVSGRQASVVGQPRMGLPGACGTAFSFDGTNDYLVTSSSAETFGHSNFTVTAWVKFTARQTKVAPIFSINSSLGLFELAMGYNAKVYVFMRDGSTGGYADLDGLDRLDNGRWHFLAVVRSGHTASLYVDGALDDYHTDERLNIVTGTGDIRIGGTQASALDAYCGLIDEVSVYNRDLSPMEVIDLALPRRQPARILGVATSAGRVAITFETWHEAATHQVLQSSSLGADGVWTPVTQGTWNAAVSTATAPITNSSQRAFFRMSSQYE